MNLGRLVYICKLQVTTGLVLICCYQLPPLIVAYWIPLNCGVWMYTHIKSLFPFQDAEASGVRTAGELP